jgi:hypothetical protein
VSVWEFLYLLTATKSFLIARLFYKTKDGMLRKLLVSFFILFGACYLFIGGTGILRTLGIFDFDYDFIRYMIVIPMWVLVTILMFYLYKHFGDIFSGD